MGEEYLNRYNGCSLDAISTYLTLIDNEENNKLFNHKSMNKRRRNKNELIINDDQQRNKNEFNDNKKEKEKEIKQWNLQKMKGYDKLNEGERKICNILKIAPNDYKFVEQQITKRVYL